MGRNRPSTTGRLVGRARELGHIDAMLDEAAAGRSSVTVVSGEPGIGKTRLCEEAAARAADGGLNVVDARCWLDGGAPPLWPWQPILRRLCGEDAAGLLDADTGHDVVDPDRFARFAAVTDHLAATSARTPVCLVVDDVHAADAGTLLLLRFVARSLPRLRMAVLLSRRTDEPPADTLAARLLADIEAEATPIVLRRLDLGESSELLGELLGAHGLDDLDPGLLRTVVQVSGGNPFYLRRIAALGAHPRDAVPDGLQVAIETSLLRLGDGTRRVLQAGAVLGLRPSVAEVAAVAEVSPAAVLDAVAEAADAGLVASEGTDRTDRFTFGHELVRATLEAGMAAAGRLEAHARAAAASASASLVAAGGGSGSAGGSGSDDGRAIVPNRLARRAHHALAAAPRSPADARIAVDACRAAARSMAASFAYEQADALLSAAMELHDSGRLPPPPGGLLVEWAQAALSCGRLAEARVRFDRAATVAELEDDPFGFAQAALGLGGHWVNEHRTPFELTRVLGLQRSALARLPDGGGAGGARGAGSAALALRVRLEARLAAEAVYQGGPIEPVLAALDRARACGDPGALAEALSLGHHALLAPEYAVTRLPLADELIRVASEAGHGVLGLMGLCWRAVDLFLVGDERAVRALEDLRVRADALACQAILYIVEAMDVMRLMRAGRLDDAEMAANRCFELGTEVGEVDTLGYLGAHLLIIRLIQDRDIELLEMAESIAASNTLIQAEFAFRAAAAMLAAKAGAQDRARSAVDRLTKDGLEALPRSSTWLVGMAAIVETALALDDAGLARSAYDLMLPYADRPVMPSLAVACLGSAARWLGLAARTFGDIDLAVAHLERAVDANRRLGNVPLVAIVRADLAGALRCRARSGDPARAEELLRTAIGAAMQLDLPLRAAAWQADLAAFAPSTPPPAPSPTPPVALPAAAHPAASGPTDQRGPAGPANAAPLSPASDGRHPGLREPVGQAGQLLVAGPGARPAGQALSADPGGQGTSAGQAVPAGEDLGGGPVGDGVAAGPGALGGDAGSAGEGGFSGPAGQALSAGPGGEGASAGQVVPVGEDLGGVPVGDGVPAGPSAPGGDAGSAGQGEFSGPVGRAASAGPGGLGSVGPVGQVASDGQAVPAGGDLGGVPVGDGVAAGPGAAGGDAGSAGEGEFSGPVGRAASVGRGGLVGHPGSFGPVGSTGGDLRPVGDGVPAGQGTPGGLGSVGPVGQVVPAGDDQQAEPAGDGAPVGPAGQAGQVGQAGLADRADRAGQVGPAGGGPVADGVEVGFGEEAGQVGLAGFADRVGRAGHVEPVGQGASVGQAGQVVSAGGERWAAPVGDGTEVGPAERAGRLGQGGPAGHVAQAGQAGQAGFVGHGGQVGPVGHGGQVGPSSAGSAGQTKHAAQTGQAGEFGQGGSAGHVGQVGQAGQVGHGGSVGDARVGLVVGDGAQVGDGGFAGHGEVGGHIVQGGQHEVLGRGGRDASGGGRVGALVRQGRGWRVELDGRRAFVTDLVGMRYIAQLLRHPGQHVAALALAGDGAGTGRVGLAAEAGHELLDERARAAYAARIQELAADLAEAESDADIGRAAKLRAELDILVDQLEAAVGLHDRPRRFADRTERARTAVRKAIKRALDEIDGADPVIGQLLRSSISTGATCVYLPDPDVPVRWSL